MACIYKFNEAELENKQGGTVALVEGAKVVNVEREGGVVTVYLEPVNGVTHYLTMNDDEHTLVRRPNHTGFTEDSPQVERSNQEIHPGQAEAASLIDSDVRAFAVEYGCGESEEGCKTCDIGVAIGLETVDRAFQSGANHMTADLPWAVLDPHQMVFARFKTGEDATKFLISHLTAAYKIAHMPEAG